MATQDEPHSYPDWEKHEINSRDELSEILQPENEANNTPVDYILEPSDELEGLDEFNPNHYSKTMLGTQKFLSKLDRLGDREENIELLLEDDYSKGRNDQKEVKIRGQWQPIENQRFHTFSTLVPDSTVYVEAKIRDRETYQRIREQL